MPIPPTLAARLAKRGILAGKKLNKDSQEQQDDKTYEDQNEEEVIAENYDDQGDSDSNQKNNGSHDLFPDDKVDEEYSYKKYRGYLGCPNKTNIYHTCAKFCEEYWKTGHTEPDSNYLKKKASMLAKYPLPVHWQEVYDPGVGRHYYWEVDSDSVSWLPPSHPRSEVSRPAAYSRQQLEKAYKEKDIANQENQEMNNQDSNSTEESDISDEEFERSRDRDSKKRKLAQEKLRARGRIKLKENSLDPMDPAAYSDVPRGGWSEGLSKGNEAKTGADVTAAGPLYQMRPYPNPGAVLRANAEARKHSPPPKESQSARPKEKSSH